MGAPFPILDTSMRIALPYNHSPDFVDGILWPYREVLCELYLPLHITVCHTTRPWHGPLDPLVYDRDVAELAEVVGHLGIRLNFVANAIVQPPQDNARLGAEVVRLARLYPDAVFTLSSLEIAARVHAAHPRIDLQPSTVSFVNNPVSAWYWKELAGASGVTVGRNINKRPELLRAIHKLGLTLRMVVNDDCVPSCPADFEHAVQMRVFDELRLTVPEAQGDMRPYVRCRSLVRQIKARYPWLIAQKDVLPSDVRRLDGLVSQVKLAGRCAADDYIRQALQAYASMEDAAEAGLHHRESPGTWERITTCDRVCPSCGWCQTHVQWDAEDPC